MMPYNFGCSFRKMRRKVLHDDNNVIKVVYMSILYFNNATKIAILHVLIKLFFTSEYDFSRIKVIKNLFTW